MPYRTGSFDGFATSLARSFRSQRLHPLPFFWFLAFEGKGRNRQEEDKKSILGFAILRQLRVECDRLKDFNREDGRIALPLFFSFFFFFRCQKLFRQRCYFRLCPSLRITGVSSSSLSPFPLPRIART